MEAAETPSGKYTWRIHDFSKREHEHSFHSEAFTVGGCKWQILIYPKGNGATDHLSIFLDVADAAALPFGWRRDAKFVPSLVDQDSGVSSMTRRPDTPKKFTTETANWGFPKFMPLTELHDLSKGYVVNDTLVVEVEVTVYDVVPPVEFATQISMLDSYFSNLSECLGATGTPPLGLGAGSVSSKTHTIDLASDTPSSDDIEKAKQSLKECLSDLFKLNVRDRLLSALSILSHARSGLSPDQQLAIEIFRANFDDFVCDFLTFEQDNSDFELQKITRDKIYSVMKRNHETHLSHKHLLESLTKEKEELSKRLKEVSLRETKLIYDWETLMNESEDAKLRYAIQEKKLTEAEGKKKIAEERMSRSTSAWSSLKEQFL